MLSRRCRSLTSGVGAIPEMKDVRRQLLEDSVAFYDRLLGMNPRDPLAYFERGYVCSLLARYENALADYGKAVELAPDVAEFHVRLGGLRTIAMTRLTATRDAAAHVKRAVELGSSATSTTAFNFGLARTSSGQSTRKAGPSWTGLPLWVRSRPSTTWSWVRMISLTTQGPFSPVTSKRRRAQPVP